MFAEKDVSTIIEVIVKLWILSNLALTDNGLSLLEKILLLRSVELIKLIKNLFSTKLHCSEREKTFVYNEASWDAKKKKKCVR